MRLRQRGLVSGLQSTWRASMALAPERGAWLGAPDALVASRVIDVEVTPLPDVRLRHGQQVLVHHGSARVTAKISTAAHELDNDSNRQWIRLRCSEPMVATVGSRLVLRRGSPAVILGSARVVALDGPPLRRTRV